MISTNKMAMIMLMIMLMLPQRGKVMTAPTVPPLKANVTNFPFSDSGTHLKEMFNFPTSNRDKDGDKDFKEISCFLSISNTLLQPNNSTFNGGCGGGVGGSGPIKVIV